MVNQNITPLPDRNHVFRREDGTELTTPDFTWEEYRIAFFMDGAYWHSVKDDKELLRDIAESKDLEKHIIDTRRDKVQKDGRIRSELASMGWRVLSCTDEDLQEEGGIRRVVGQIRTATQTTPRRSVTQTTPPPQTHGATVHPAANHLENLGCCRVTLPHPQQ